MSSAKIMSEVYRYPIDTAFRHAIKIAIDGIKIQIEEPEFWTDPTVNFQQWQIEVNWYQNRLNLYRETLINELKEMTN